MAKALIVYSSRTGDTKNIGDIIAEGLRFSGVDVTIKNAGDVKNESEFNGYDIYVFGSATYNSEIMGSMKKLFFIAEKADLEGKIGGSFGAYGWSGEAPERIHQTMEHIFKMDMASDTLRLKSVSLEGGLQMAQDYGKNLAGKLG